jgi:uncharacterized protein YcgI (DUF1989 family)
MPTGSVPSCRRGGARALPEIAPRSGTAFTLDRGHRLVVTDPCGEQVADLLAFGRADAAEALSSGRTLD